MLTVSAKAGAYLSVADLQRARVQLFDPGVVRGHQHAVLPPQDGGGGVPRHRAAEDHRPVHGHRLVDRALPDDGRRAVRHDCEGRKARISATVTGASQRLPERAHVATRARETNEIQLEQFLII